MGFESRQCFRFWNDTDESWHGPYFDSQDDLDEFHDWVIERCPANKWVNIPKVSDEPAMVRMLNRLGPHYFSISETHLEELKTEFIKPVEKETVKKGKKETTRKKREPPSSDEEEYSEDEDRRSRKRN